MIADTIKNIEKYRGLSKNLDTAIAFLKEYDISTLPDGKTVVDGARVFVNVMEADLREAEGAAYEYHKKYADIQINIDGSERWEYTVDGSPEGTFDVASDFGLKKGDASGCGTLGDDRFVIFFPDELHKPSCINGSCRHVRKAVVKVEMS